MTIRIQILEHIVSLTILSLCIIDTSRIAVPISNSCSWLECLSFQYGPVTLNFASLFYTKPSWWGGRHSTPIHPRLSHKMWSAPVSSGKNNYNRPSSKRAILSDHPPYMHLVYTCVHIYIYSAHHLATPLHVFAVRRSCTKS